MYGIYRNPFRVFINHINWNVSAGYGATNFKHNLEGYWLFEGNGNLFVRPKLPNEEAIPTLVEGYSNWLNAPRPGPPVIITSRTNIPYNYIPNPINNPLLRTANYANGDTVFYTGFGSSIPVTASAHVEFFNFKVGAGYTFEPQWIRDFQSENETPWMTFTPNFWRTSFHRAYGIIGYRFYEYWNYAAVADIQLGKLWYGSVFDPLALQSNININAGITLEHHWSEYFALTLRPSFDWKRYQINLPDGNFILHQHNSFMLQFGVSIRIPEIPRSPIPADHVQLKHVITDPATGKLMEVRGQPFWKVQNPKVGENHRKLWRYKWRNKRKLHPY